MKITCSFYQICPQFIFSCLISNNQKNWIYPDSGLSLKLCTLNTNTLARCCCWLDLCLCCVMTGGPGREKPDEYSGALLEIGSWPELYFSPRLFFISSQTPSQGHFSSRDISEGVTANQNHCSMLASFELWSENYRSRFAFCSSGIPCCAPQVHPD